MTEPSKAARERRDELYEAVGWPDNWSLADVHAHAFALYIDEVDRVAQRLEGACSKWGWTEDGWPVLDLRSLMLPDPVDPDEELAREIKQNWPIGPGDPPSINEIILATIKRLREQGRLKDV